MVVEDESRAGPFAGVGPELLLLGTKVGAEEPLEHLLEVLGVEVFRRVPGTASGDCRRGCESVPRLRSTLIWTTDGLTNSATATNASDSAWAAFWLSAGIWCGGHRRVRPRELTRAAVETTSAAQATALRFIPLTLR